MRVVWLAPLSGWLACGSGESWAHAATSRVILFWHEGQRFAHLHKSPSRPTATVPYAVTAAGIRDAHLPVHRQPPRGQKREWQPPGGAA